MTALYDPQSEWARLLLSSFAEAGVVDVVNSPGSRSTPFVLAAAAEPRLRITSIIDERDAAFFAVGQAKASGRPSLLLCTSGSAPAHYLPAILEARATRTPLLVLSADRPLEVQGAGALQTADQLKLFGDAALRFFELGGVDASDTALRGLRRIVTQAVALAHSGGAVHCNVRARKPLEPREPRDDHERAASRAIHAARGWPLARWSGATAVADRDGLGRIAAIVAEGVEGVVLAGPSAGDAESLRAIARRAGYPLLVEATGAHDGVEVGALALLGAADLARASLQPRVVIQVGGPPVSAAYDKLVAAAAQVVILSAHADADAESRATCVSLGDPSTSCRALDAMLAARGLDRRDAPFARRWTAALQRAAAAVPSPAPTAELAFTRAVLDALPAVPLFVGNSLPVRQVDLACALGAAAPRAFHQRGTSGIDGLVAGAAGVASIAGPTALLLGDVSLLHDLHGLLVASAQPLVVIVVNNGGGRIFDTLPIGRRADLAAERALFTTPCAVDLSALARGFSIPYARAEAATDVRAILDAAFARRGASLVELIVDPQSAAQLAAALPALVDRALEALA
jgi:2-succinyl-5-enolpyruvyl-6-hydroxy-3-cyclohexene-1-carboxylate synthase